MTRAEAVTAIAAKQIELGACSDLAIKFADRTAGRILAKLQRRPWQTPAELTAKNRSGRRIIADTSKYLAELRAIGAVQVAWDAEGYSYWAPCGTELTGGLVQD